MILTIATTASQIDSPAVEIAESATPEVKAAAVQAILSEGPVEVSEVLRDKRDETFALVQKLLNSAGINRTFTLSETEDNADTELSPEQLGFMATLKTRYENNEHDIACHSVAEWSKIEAKLRANPAKLDTLKRMNESGGAPDIYKVEGEDFIFGDLSSKAPEDRRNVNYSQAVAEASQMGEGCKLMHPDDYLMIGNDLGIAMDEHPERVWLDSAHRSDRFEVGAALIGYRYDGKADVDQDFAYYDHYGNRAFRCSLRV